MIPNVVAEYVWMNVWMVIEEYHLRDQMRCPCNRWIRYLLYVYPVAANLCLYWTMCHPEIFSGLAQRGVKAFVAVSLVLTRELLFCSGILASFITFTIIDFVIGVCVAIRFGILLVLQMPMEYTEGEFLVLPIFLLIVLTIIAHYTVMEWAARFSDYINYPGLPLKIMAAAYMVPCLFFIRPPEILDFLSDGNLLLVSSLVMLSVLILGWTFFTGQRRKMLQENELLQMQTGLFVEHTNLLQEQKNFVKLCREYLKKADMKLQKISIIDQIMTEKEANETQAIQIAVRNYQKQCAVLGIELKTDFGKQIVGNSEKDILLLTVLYNLLDNAVESADQCEGKNRYILLKGYLETSGIHLTVRNGRYIGLRKKKSSVLQRNHQGIGLRIVRDIVKQHHGTMEVERGKDYFQVEIYLPEG